MGTETTPAAWEDSLEVSSEVKCILTIWSKNHAPWYLTSEAKNVCVYKNVETVKRSSHLWWCTSVIWEAEHWKAEAGELLGVRDQPGFHYEFNGSLKYIARFCLKKKKNQLLPWVRGEQWMNCPSSEQLNCSVWYSGEHAPLYICQNLENIQQEWAIMQTKHWEKMTC